MVASLYCRFTVDSEGPGTAVLFVSCGVVLWEVTHCESGATLCVCLRRKSIVGRKSTYVREPSAAPCPMKPPAAPSSPPGQQRDWLTDWLQAGVGGGSPGLGSFGCSCGPGGHEKRTGNGHLSGGVCAVWLLSLLRAPPPWWMRGRVTRATSKSPTCWFSV